jgi:hypothetical protein
MFGKLGTAVLALGFVVFGSPSARAGWGDPAFEAYSWRNYELAAKLWAPLESQTAPDVVTRIGWMYKYGEGVEIDLQKAAYYFEKASKAGDAWAQFNLGYVYHFGEGSVEKDLVKAYMWYTLALEGRYERSQTRMNQAAAQMTAEQIALAQQLAAVSPYKPRAAEDQIMAGTLREAKEMFQREYMIARNKEIGEREMQGKEEEKRTFGEMFGILFDVLGNMPDYMASVFDTRVGGRTWSEVPKNVTKKAPENTSVARYYQFGEKLEARYVEAAEQFEEAAKRGDVSAAANLGYLYFFGNGVPLDILKAHMWFSLAARGGITRAESLASEVEERMVPEQIEEATKMADQWTEKHATGDEAAEG